MDNVFIEGLELWTRVGCTAQERFTPQRLEMDVTMEAPLHAAGQKDDLRLTVDYAAVAERLRKRIEPKIYKLVEAVAEEASALILKEFKVNAVALRVRKFALPGMAGAGVEIRRP
jgi:7,8-dihydroneopterin aldolase/epimerase/oxygenase